MPGPLLAALGIDVLARIGGHAVDGIVWASKRVQARRLAKRCSVCGQRRDAHEGYRLRDGYVGGISCADWVSGEAFSETISDAQWAESCDICGESRKMHAFGRMPGRVLVEGMGIFMCATAPQEVEL